ncbi:MAG: SAM-dependent chlorinase/fluorinase [Alphaproteobacteria bacterium]|nr:SAM-dependent chlorinase/fluorinase [Alphaproteobacteria bacterium]MDP6814532.1 SAM-dependent chlorinase/fluorinase [Alphaproteobacteria bacterium]
MIVLFTDFGHRGPYVGQMRAVLHARAPGVPVVDLFRDAPTFDPRAAAYLLAAFCGEFAAGTVFLCVVDPGVGGDRPPLAVSADGRWFVGPGNGLFEVVARRAAQVEARCIDWRPSELSASFHGRDLFAPIAAGLARGQAPPAGVLDAAAWRRPDWPDDLARVIYIDDYGNVMTGIRAATLGPETLLIANGRRLKRARTFGDRPVGEAFWYENANGLAEIAVNQGNAAALLDLSLGDAVTVDGA